MQFNKFRRIFHPDKLTNDYYKDTAQQIFNRIVHSYKIHEDSLQSYLFLNYGKMGIQLYQNFHEFFVIIEQEINQGKFNQDYIFQKYSKEIQGIVDFLYYNDQTIKQMPFSTQIVYQMNGFDDLTENDFQTTFGYPIKQQIFGAQIFPSIYLAGNLDQGFKSGFNLQLSKALKFRDTQFNFSAGFNSQDLYQPNCRVVFEYKDFNFNVSHKIGSSNYDAVSTYHLNENQAVKLGCEYQEGTPNFYAQFINAISFNNGYSLYNENTISAHIIRNTFKLKKQINNNFSLKAKIKIVNSFHHFQNQYYKIGQFYVGYKYKHSAYEFSSGLNFQHSGIQYFDFCFKLYNFKLKIPLFINDDIRVLALGICLVLGGSLFFGIKSIIDEKKSKIRKLQLEKNIFLKLQDEINEWKCQFLVEDSIIQKASLIPLLIKKKHIKQSSIDVTKLVQQLYLIEGKVGYNKLVQVIEQISKENAELIFKEYDFKLKIQYEIDKRVKHRTIIKNETTYLKKIWFFNSNEIIMKLLQ